MWCFHRGDCFSGENIADCSSPSHTSLGCLCTSKAALLCTALIRPGLSSFYCKVTELYRTTAARSPVGASLVQISPVRKVRKVRKPSTQGTPPGAADRTQPKTLCDAGKCPCLVPGHWELVNCVFTCAENLFNPASCSCSESSGCACGDRLSRH